MTLMRLVRDLAKNSRQQPKSAFLDKKKLHIFGYDSINWQQKVDDKGIDQKNAMKAATHGTLYVIDTSTMLQKGLGHPVCHPQLISDLLGPDMPHPTVQLTNAIPPKDLHSMPMLRKLRDQMRQQPLPAPLHPSDILQGAPEEEHLLQAILSHVRTAFLARYDSVDFKDEKEVVPDPPQVWPQIVRKTKVISLPVLDVDEGTTKGNLQVLKEYLLLHLKIPDSFWKENVLFVSADAYSVGKLRTGQKTRNIDRSSQEFDRFSAPQALPAPWHFMVSFVQESE
ncbi:hypothetical protein CF327_g1965 [Tilletia walkeri]|nr:hypothetical protein CF327_g1965 [Tilletia walkeri]